MSESENDGGVLNPEHGKEHDIDAFDYVNDNVKGSKSKKKKKS